MWQVAAGLDSQILGDYEIVGQIKNAVKFAKERALLACLANALLMAHCRHPKRYETNTGISGGTVSVSFAAIQYLKATVPAIADKKILIIGTGKIGGSTCRNIIDYLHNTNITVINRTAEKAIELADELNIAQASYDDLNQEVQAADVIIVSANAAQPILTKAQFSATDTKVLIDLSIPNNIDASVKELARHPSL